MNQFVIDTEDFGVMQGILSGYGDQRPRTMYTRNVDVQTLKINYSNGDSYTVRNPFDITVYRTKGGGHNIRYSVNVDMEDEEPFGTIKGEGFCEYHIKTEDVVSIEVKEHQELNNTRLTEYVEFGVK